MSTVSNEYLRNAVLTASPEQLHLMLYDGAIRFARLGIDGIRHKKWEDAFNGFSRAQKILLEMLNALNYDVDEDLCKRMASLYSFIYRKLVEASVHRNPDVGEEALKLLEYQRETWVMLMEKLQSERKEDSSGEGPSPVHHGEFAATEDATYGHVSFEG